MPALKRTYVVLREVQVDTHWGDHGFVLLGFFEARQPREAMQLAREEYEGMPAKGLVAVPSRYWSAA